MKNVSKADIKNVIEKQGAWDYNRQIDPAFIDVWENEANYKLIKTMPHNHRHGVECEPHIRTMLTKNNREIIAFIDMPNDEYESIGV